MLKTLRRWRNRNRLIDARFSRQLAHAAYIRGRERGDTREMYRTWRMLVGATMRVLELEG